jgi:ureidoacrylate peracid hydrolase
VFVRLITRDETRKDDEPILCAEGTRGADFIGPQPLAGETIISKTRYSAFARTGLAEQLHAQGIDTLVLAGLTTECCVASSAWDGFEHDFHITLAADACAAYEENLHRHALKALELSGAKVVASAKLAACWKKSL